MKKFSLYMALLLVRCAMLAAIPDFTIQLNAKSQLMQYTIGVEDTLVFDLAKDNLVGSTVEIPVSLQSNDVINSFDFRFKFDARKVTFQTIINHKAYLNTSFFYNPNDSILRFTGYSLQSIEKNTPLVTIRFSRVQNVMNVSDIRFTSASLLNGEPCATKIMGNFCTGEPLTLTAPSGPGYSYLWSTGETTQSIIVDSQGLYFATISQPGGSSFSSAITSLKGRPSPLVSVLASGPTSICPGDSVQLNAQTAPENILVWSTGQTGNSVFASEEGSYSAIVTNPFGCSASSNTIHVAWLPVPDASISPSGPLNFCGNDSVILSVQKEAGNTYQWSTGEASPSITVKNSGEYSVVITGNNGCSSVSAPANVTVYPLPVAVIASGPITACTGDSVILRAGDGEGYGYLWSTNEITSSIVVYVTGDYFVAVTDLNNCSATSSTVHIEIGPLKGDINRDSYVDGTDYLLLLSKIFTQCFLCEEDISGDGNVDGTDFLILLGNMWSSCH